MSVHRRNANRPSSKPRRGIAAALMRLWLSFRYRWISRRYRKLVLENIDGVDLVILPDVFNPVLLRSGAFLARFIESYSIDAGSSVLDLGTGSGAAAIFAARKSADVTAVDINPAAVRCAQINALLNQYGNRIKVLQGDLFEPVRHRQFDLIIFNPPFYTGKPIDELDRAWRGEDVFERFASGLGAVLNPDGRALLILSTDGDGEMLLNLLDEKGYKLKIMAERDLVNEVLAIYELRLI